MRARLRSFLPHLLLLAACGSQDPVQTDGSPVLPGSPPGSSGADGGGSFTPDGGTGTPGTPGTPSTPGGPAKCEEHKLDSSLRVPDMLIVLDRSGSMNPDEGSPTDRWGGSRDAIVDVTGRYDDRIRFGLMTFPEYLPDGQVQRCAPGTVNVPVGLNAGDNIASTLQSMDADGRTPTAATLVNALGVLELEQPNPDQKATPKYILLVTDGDPNCTSVAVDGVDQPARDATVRAIEALHASGIPTFVVGFETAGTEFEGQLDRMALAGGTGATAHTSVESGADLTAVFEELAKRVASCTHTLNKPVEKPTYVAVSVGGTTRAYDDLADGWTLADDAQTITLTGKACDDLKLGGALSIEVQCAPVTLK